MATKKKTTHKKKMIEGDYNYDGQGITRGNVKCSTCRGGELQRYRCSLTGANPVTGCNY